MNITPVLHKAPLKSFDEKMNDLNYWLAQPLIKSLEAVTFLISQTVDLKTTRFLSFVSPPHVTDHSSLNGSFILVVFLMISFASV
jgi:hypothetical protein